MTQTRQATVLQHIRRLAARCPDPQSDLQLLQRFLAERDEAAFAALVQRHGGMVLGVCRRVLHHQQDAEDVFRATFLILARRADTIRKHDALSAWLHGVAYRLALKARAQGARRRSKEQTGQEADGVHVDDLTFGELRTIIDEELQRLPAKYLAPLLLCYWEGKTRDEAAAQLGITPDAFKKHLERARNLLGSRLATRGLAPSAAFLAALFSDNLLRAATSAALTHHTAQAAVAFAAGCSRPAGATAASAALAQGAIRIMNITKWTSTLFAVLLVGSLGAGVSLGTYEVFGGHRPDLLLAGATPVAVKAKTPPRTDAERLVGVWKFSEGRSNGSEMPKDFIIIARLSFSKDGTLTMAILQDAKKGKYKLGGPGKIEVQMSGGDDFNPAIYKFEGDDRVKLCIASEATGDRPKEFTGENGTRQVLFVLERAKPGEEDPAKLKGPVDQLREAAARTMSQNNLKQIGLAFHNYHDVSGNFPTHAIYSKDGKTPLLSWRVAILPYIDHNDLYKQFKLDEPWDSAHNKKLIAKMPRLYEPVGAAKKSEGMTYYQVFTGPDTPFQGPKGLKFTDITDGTSNTILALEAKDAVVWTKPHDLVLPKDKLPAIGGLFKNGTNALLCDGSVRFLATTIEPAELRKLITPTAGD